MALFLKLYDLILFLTSTKLCPPVDKIRVLFSAFAFTTSSVLENSAEGIL